MTQNASTQTVDRYELTKARIAQQYSDAAAHLTACQAELIKAMEAGQMLQTSTVERLFLAEQAVRVNRQIVHIADTSTDKTNLLALLRTWMEDAVEQIMSPGYSTSSSLVRTEQMRAEESAIKTVHRTVGYYVGHLTD